MNKIFYLVLFAMVMVSCSKSKEQKAEALVKESVKKVLFKPETYKPVETKVDSAFAPYDDPGFSCEPCGWVVSQRKRAFPLALLALPDGCCRLFPSLPDHLSISALSSPGNPAIRSRYSSGSSCPSASHRCAAFSGRPDPHNGKSDHRRFVYLLLRQYRRQTDYKIRFDHWYSLRHCLSAGRFGNYRPFFAAGRINCLYSLPDTAHSRMVSCQPSLSPTKNLHFFLNYQNFLFYKWLCLYYNT